jgi:hypothetical protein
MRIWKEIFVICLKADFIAFVEGEKKRTIGYLADIRTEYCNGV